MSRWSKLGLRVSVVVVAALLLMPVAVSADDGVSTGKIIFGRSFELADGERLDGDLAVFGGDVTLREGSILDGDALVAGGNLDAAGEIDGDVVIFGGNANLRSTVEVDGDVITLGGTTTTAEGAVVRGRTSEGFSIDVVPDLRAPDITPPGWGVSRGDRSWVLTWFLRGIRALGGALVLSLLALLVLSLWPKQTEQVATTVWRFPAASFGFGLLTLLVIPGLMVLLTVLIVTVCVVPLLALAAAVAWLFGWIALGLLVGRRVLVALKARNAIQLWQAALGVFLISLLGALPCVGWLVWTIGGAFGMGAAILTRFGTQPYGSEQAGEEPELDDRQLALPEEDLEQAEYGVVEAWDEGGGVERMEDAESMSAEERPEEAPAGDELERISGIGPVFAARLRGRGITTFAQVAQMSSEELAEIVELFPERVVEDDWVGQAKELAEG